MTLSRSNDSNAEALRLHEEKRRQDEVSRSSESVAYQPQSVEFSAPLENSIPLEAPRMRYVVASNPTTSHLPASTSTKSERLPTTPQSIPQVVESMPPVHESAPAVIQLLDERLVVDRRRRKVGEVIVRKEIETHIVEVPIHREKLIVEQVSPEYEQLAVVELGQPQVNEFNSLADPAALSPTVSGNFTSVDAAIQFLQAIAAESGSGLQQVQISVGVKDITLQATHQRLLEQYST